MTEEGTEEKVFDLLDEFIDDQPGNKDELTLLDFHKWLSKRIARRVHARKKT